MLLYCTKFNGLLNLYNISDAFESCQGVKHGCPLSPTLFVFLLRALLIAFVDAKDWCNPIGMHVEKIPVIDSTRIPTMFYADCLNLLAHNHQRLMCVLTALGEWCTAFCMTVHTRKCEVVYFHPDQKHCLLASQVLRVELRCLDGNQYEFQARDEVGHSGQVFRPSLRSRLTF
ncbi:hypothetical protein Vretifemale_4953 [Volvox reticuliferus]|uniref:Reverse transcriptase domain-containing protein n=1 Tax=Volvox reticuliferus TaxID=1737510 RepID=A0A8J4FJU5_9CHLO|nr:hypothetical protein Vretifemale_4953 [Volvox reticuliferus]